MDITTFFARLYGAFYIVFGLLFIVTRQLGRTIEMTEARKNIPAEDLTDILDRLGNV